MKSDIGWRSCVLLGLLLPASANATPLPDDHGCLGHWIGRGRNTGYSTYWTIDLTLTSAPDGTRCGTIEYTNPNCGGFLEACRVVGDEIHTRENYTHRDSSCAPPGRVIIRCQGDTMRYSWIGWERVDSTLRRVGGGPSATPPPAAGTPPPPAPPVHPPSTPSPVQPIPSPPPSPSPAPSQPPVGDTPPPSPNPPTEGDSESPWGWLPGCAVAGAHVRGEGGFAWALVLLAIASLGRSRCRSRRCKTTLGK